MSIPEPQEQLKAAWDAGVPLQSAWAAFSVLFDRSAQIPVSTHPTKGIRFATDDVYGEEVRTPLPRSPRGRQIRGSRSREHSQLLAQICAGRLWAIGLRAGSAGLDELVRIPPEHFHTGDRQGPRARPRILWDKSALTTSDTRYIEIRVVPGPISGDEIGLQARQAMSVPNGFALARPRGIAQSKKANTITGRPNTSREISATARRLWKTDLKFRALSLKAMVLEVRATILGEDCRDQEIVGYKAASMEKTISRALNDLRNPNKRNKGKKQNA